MKSNKKTRNKVLLTLLLIITGFGISLLSAQNPVPGPAQSEDIAITNATIHVGNGEVIENGQILFSNGKIQSVSRTSTDLPTGYQVVDANGKHIYPGLIALNSSLGLVEIGAVRSTRDQREVGTFNPNVRAMIAFNTDSQIIPTVRSRGVLLAQATPQGGRISGKSSVMQLDGWNFEDAVRGQDEGAHFNWPWKQFYSWWSGEVRKNNNYDQQLRDLALFMEQSKAYCSDNREGEVQLKLAAMCDLYSGNAKAYFHVDDASDIQATVLFAKKHGMDPVIVGGEESYLVTDFLKQHEVSVILGSTQSLPSGPDEDVDQPFKTPAQLAEAGVDFAISHGGYWEQRNLPFTAGTAVAYGLPYESAIQALTLTPARITGIDDEYGSLEAGKSATLIVVGGDLLDMRQSKVEHAFIDGRKVNLDNKQAYLYRKFGEKYERMEK